MKIKNNILFALLFILSSIQAFADISTFATNLTFSNITSSSMTLNWTVGGGIKRMVIARKGALPAVTINEPTFNSTYTANSNYTLGQSLASGKVVYFGTGTSVTVTGLDATSTYYFSIIEVEETPYIYYATNEVDTWKLDGNASTTSGSSISAPTSISSGPASATVTDLDSMRVTISGSFANKGNGTGRLLLLRPCNSSVQIPSNNVVKQKYTYAMHDAIFGGSRDSVYWVNNFSLVVDYGDFKNFSFTFRRMPGLQLAVDVFEYNGNVALGTAVYNTTPLTFCADAGSSGGSSSAPTIGATNLNFTSVGQNSLTLNWVSGNGTARIVIASKGSEMNVDPTNNTTYTASSVFGNGSALGGGFVVYNGSGNSVNITGLDSTSTYYFTVIEYLTGSGTITYASSLKTTSSTKTLGASSSLDSDEDGVPDESDDFPNDSYKAFSTGYPAAGYGTMLFEDLWPGKGDYDFNDLVLNYHYDVVTDATDNVVEVKYSFVTRAIGGSLHNGFAFQLDGIPASSIHSVERVGSSKVTGISYATFNDNGTEANQTNANIIVFKDAYDLLPHSNGYAFINVEAGAPNEGTDTTQIIVKFSSNGVRPEGSAATAIADFTHAIFNPYLIVGQERGKEVHKANRVPSSLVNNNYFGQHQDNSNPAQNVYYKTSTGLPWVLDVTESVPYATEKTDFTEAFLKFAEWAISGGSSYTDWYQDLSNYRNTNKIFSGN